MALLGSSPILQAQTTVHLSDTAPNIIFVLTDDQGYGDLGCHGHPYLKTPNIDKLYNESTRLTDYHVSPTCAPTRSSLMSGRAPFKNGITHTILERERMALSSSTFAEALKESGYTTGIFGKWHLGDEAEYQPDKRGFDEMFIHGAGGIGQAYAGSCADVPDNSYFDPIIKHNDRFVKTNGYCTDVFFKQALGWIKENKNRPFFAYISTNAPHEPYICPENYKKRYKKKSRNQDTASFYGMITNIDDNIGIMMDKLKQWELDNNTLVIFMTDNGSAAGDFNAGMKGMKNSAHEGGSRVPAFFWMPGKIAAGQDVTQLTRHVDIFPTLTDLAGATNPKGLEGRSLLPLIQDPTLLWPDRYTFFHKGRWGRKGAPFHGSGRLTPEIAKNYDFAVRNEEWRLVGKKSLYKIQKDPGEKRNLIRRYPKVAKEMLIAYYRWWDEVRPFMINEEVELAPQRPYHVLYRNQLASEEGILDWEEPEL